jgi:maltose O-acetyltransferase
LTFAYQQTNQPEKRTSILKELEVGEHFFANFDASAGHPLDLIERAKGIEFGKPVTIGTMYGLAVAPLLIQMSQ